MTSTFSLFSIHLRRVAETIASISDDKVEGLRLSSSFDNTSLAWKKRFDVDYTLCGCPLPSEPIGKQLKSLLVGHFTFNKGKGKGKGLKGKEKEKGKEGGNTTLSYSELTHPVDHPDVLSASHPSDHDAVRYASRPSKQQQGIVMAMYKRRVKEKEKVWMGSGSSSSSTANSKTGGVSGKAKAKSTPIQPPHLHRHRQHSSQKPSSPTGTSYSYSKAKEAGIKENLDLDSYSYPNGVPVWGSFLFPVPMLFKSTNDGPTSTSSSTLMITPKSPGDASPSPTATRCSLGDPTIAKLPGGCASVSRPPPPLLSSPLVCTY